MASLTRRLVPVIVWGTGLYGVYTYLGAGVATFGFTMYCPSGRGLWMRGNRLDLIGGRSADRLGAKYTAGVSLAGLSVCFCLLLVALRIGVFVDLVVGLSAAGRRSYSFPLSNPV